LLASDKCARLLLEAKMIIEQRVHKPTEYYTPRRPCTKCGTSWRYLSTRHCVACKRAHDRAREGDRRSERARALDLEGDRRSERARALDLLARRESIHIRELPKAMQDAFLRANYPNWRDNENNL
jgi:hypothetical protein